MLRGGAAWEIRQTPGRWSWFGTIAPAQLAYPCQRLVLRLDAVLLKVWTIELHASRLGKRPGEARWGAYPNEILLWRVPLESAEVRLRLGRALKDVRRDAALFQRFA